jgi:hypothetical protein
MADEREVQPGPDHPEAVRADLQPPQVIEGEDDVPRQPAPLADPITPEPGPRPGEERAFRVLPLAWIPVAIVVAIVIWAALR